MRPAEGLWPDACLSVRVACAFGAHGERDRSCQQALEGLAAKVQDGREPAIRVLEERSLGLKVCWF